jgi:hypothetical protein
MEPIELGERLGRWPAGRGPLHVLQAARPRLLIDEGELPPGEPLPPTGPRRSAGGRPQHTTRTGRRPPAASRRTLS